MSRRQHLLPLLLQLLKKFVFNTLISKHLGYKTQFCDSHMFMQAQQQVLCYWSNFVVFPTPLAYLYEMLKEQKDFSNNEHHFHLLKSPFASLVSEMCTIKRRASPSLRPILTRIRRRPLNDGFYNALARSRSLAIRTRSWERACWCCRFEVLSSLAPKNHLNSNLNPGNSTSHICSNRKVYVELKDAADLTDEIQKIWPRLYLPSLRNASGSPAIAIVCIVLIV